MGEGLYAGFGRVMMSPYRMDENGKYLTDAEGKKILMYLPLGGYGNNSKRLCRLGRAEGTQAQVYDRDLAFELYNSCIAFRDAAGETVLHFSTDAIRALETRLGEAREILKEKYGIRPENVYLTSTHTHSGIDYGENSEVPFIDGDGRESSCKANNAVINPQYVQSLVAAAEMALADLAPVTALQAGRVRVGRPDGRFYNYVRNYPLVANNDPACGVGVLGPNFNDVLSGELYLVNGEAVKPYYYVGPEDALPEERLSHMSVANHDMLLLWTEREGKKPIALCNFRAHGTMQSGGIAKISQFGVEERFHYSPDFIGPFRDKVEHELDCLCLYVQGECGNINPKSNLAKEQLPELTRHDVEIFDAEGNSMGRTDIPNDFGVYGQGLAEFAVMALREPEKLTDCLGSGRVRSLYHYSPVPFRSGEYYTEIDENALQICRDMVDYFAKTYGTAEYDLKNINAMAKASGGAIHSYYHAGNVIRRKAMEPYEKKVELAAYRIGDVAVALSPCEMFDTDGDLVKAAGEKLGYVNTLMCGYSNQFNSYIPSELGFTQGKTVQLAGETKGSYVKADGTVVEFDAPTKGMFGCYEADQCLLAPVYGAGNKPLYGTYDGSDGIHRKGDPIYVGEHLAAELGEMLAELR